MIRITCFIFISLLLSCSSTKREPVKPNVIIIFTDDQGYQDLGVYGSPLIKTPNIDRLAREGIRFTDFYVAASICSPSRASLLTGQYSFRNDVGNVFFPDSKGMKSEAITIAEILKPEGYKTACIGKWHLGDLAGNLPTHQGFDEYFGVPYSNDMYIGSKQEFANQVNFRIGYDLDQAKEDQAFVEANRKNRQAINDRGIKELVPLMQGNKIIEYPADQATLTKRYFERAMDFINRADKTPFLVYLTPAMPHVPLFASEDFEGISKRGLYGDVIEEIDWHTGQMLEFLKEKGLDENTIIIYSSDNGPWLGYGDHAGSAEPLRDGKFTNYEGGVRVPCIMRWSGKWASGVTSSVIASTLDLMPTIAHYTRAKLPTETLDGMNLADHLENPTKEIDRDVMLYTKGTQVYGIRKGDWKYLPFSGARNANEESEPELYNLSLDPSETNNLAMDNPAKVNEMQILLNKINK